MRAVIGYGENRRKRIRQESTQNNKETLELP